MPDRRLSLTTKVQWVAPSMADMNLIVTFGFDDDYRLREVFCAGFRADTDICALANDACVILSRLLQMGDSVVDVAASMGENREEGRTSGPPSSLLGAIVREAARVEADVLLTVEEMK